jgi:hypothetical protein
MKNPIIGFGLFLALIQIGCGTLETRESDQLAGIYATMDQIVITEKVFKDTPLREVLAFLLNVGHINTTVSLPAPYVAPKISVDWKNISFRDALQDVCKKANLYWRIESNRIVISSEIIE